MTALVSPSEEAGLVDTFSAMGPGGAARRDLERESGLLIGVRLQGNFKTAFPDGPPKEEEATDAEGEDAKEEEDAPSFLTESEGRGAVVLVTDVDMLYDRFASAPFRSWARPSWNR